MHQDFVKFALLTLFRVFFYALESLYLFVLCSIVSLENVFNLFRYAAFFFIGIVFYFFI